MYVEAFSCFLCLERYIRSTQRFQAYVISCTILFWSIVGTIPSEINCYTIFQKFSKCFWLASKIFKIMNISRILKKKRFSKYRLWKFISLKFKFDFDWTPYPEESEGENSSEDIEFMFELNLRTSQENRHFPTSFLSQPFSSPKFQ